MIAVKRSVHLHLKRNSIECLIWIPRFDHTHIQTSYDRLHTPLRWKFAVLFQGCYSSSLNFIKYCVYCKPYLAYVYSIPMKYSRHVFWLILRVEKKITTDAWKCVQRALPVLVYAQFFNNRDLAHKICASIGVSFPRSCNIYVL